MVGGVMFDFSGTLMRVESAEQALRGVLGSSGPKMDDAEFTACAGRLEAMGAIPGGAPPREVPAHVAALWRDREDLSAEFHRACYTGLARAAGLPDPALADALYDRSSLPVAWRPYPDAEKTLHALRERGIRLAVVSNIGWDPRPVLKFHGLDRYFDVLILSYEVGVEKPDPRIFQAACDELGLPPADVLMVGDDRQADTGAAALGCRVHLVDHLPVDLRPDSLARVLDLI
ncbi:HAD superfamily hydrolase (TIGR01493 family)/HAD superfamily hydrolase (TIGR01509 family)/HAD superfamily hydrolase (TIGR01549 family) [Actinocorallia herbida]|uniref:HAD superfamily hydrolase (TIGR01493 family)/HAD superfamily hydrolase (TIGR01509 family)/HAD superfamily hydrolase (TIGR01549 family) n=1 Tax=Actinocorallia herbida TaxID=58109 RepID=A0A3N1CVT9_9ACTN|nr:HAD family hydrolase [Actinocorallia herbida]ROO85364.1 HAD superfamily hydrolase (TIGR01493 family)/HAD superfamily hydrolase (TIGR01509 family)/HAD superfamily hydrolase (TIGR01549 family) [Actinocorallia herbida]